MKKIFITILLNMAMPLSSVFCQHPELDSWYRNIRRTAFNIQTTENTYIKKEILYNGSIVPVAYGKFSYSENDSSTITVPFLYSYGRITFAKEKFDKMMTMPNSTKVTVILSFLPVNLSVSKKKKDVHDSISFIISNGNIHDLYLNKEDLQLHSYWAITTMNDCYLVAYSDYSLGGWFFYIPYEQPKRRRYEIKLEKLHAKQYEKGESILYYFN